MRWSHPNCLTTDITSNETHYCLLYILLVQLIGEILYNDITSESSARRKSCFRCAKCMHFSLWLYLLLIKSQWVSVVGFYSGNLTSTVPKTHRAGPERTHCGTLTRDFLIWCTQDITLHIIVRLKAAMHHTLYLV